MLGWTLAEVENGLRGRGAVVEVVVVLAGLGAAGMVCGFVFVCLVVW